MSGIVKERYTPRVIGVNTSVTLTSTDLGGFLAITAGTLTVVNAKGVTIVNALPVIAGSYYPMPFYLSGAGSVVTTAGGASGTLAV